MAKVSEIKFNIKGEDFKINVNCNSSGNFNANIPDEVAKALRIDKKLSSTTLSELESIFKAHLLKYKSLETFETLHILISYQAKGRYMERKDGSDMFGNRDEKHNINISFSEIKNAVGFDYWIAIKESIDGKDEWYSARLGKDFPHWDKEQNENPNKYFKYSKMHQMKRFKIIPFDDIALETLKNAEEKLRQASEVLFNFISKDEEEILLTLTNNKLLS